MADLPTKKRRTVDWKELTEILWGHYRNYLDSCDNADGGDYDELHELLQVASEHVEADIDAADVLAQAVPSNLHVTALLPVLLSVTHYHLADVAISEYIRHQATEHDVAVEAADASEAWRHVAMAVRYYPFNASAWSMGANFGRMSKRLSPSVTRRWYVRAVSAACDLRPTALALLEDERVDSLVKEWIELLVLHQVLGVEFLDRNGDDDNNEDEEEDDHKAEDDEDGFYSYSTVEATSRFMLAMLSSTTGNHDCALQHLKHFLLTHRIHPNVWQTTGTVGSSSSEIALFEPVAYRPAEGFLPKNLYGRLTAIFAPDAPFWRESDYSNRGYYSFFSTIRHQTDGKSEPTNVIEDVVLRHMLPRAQEVLEKCSTGNNGNGNDDDRKQQICGFEWWAHTRPVQANLGHNLHFDTDESMLAKEGRITHPVISSVLYLTGGSGEGGPTIVFDQTPASKQVAQHCWKSTPRDNTYMMFPGNLLHGVLPCPGNTGTETEDVSMGGTKDTKALIDLCDEFREPSVKAKSDTRHRLTLLVGFWTRNVPQSMSNRRLYGPCGFLPSDTKEHTWVRQLSAGYDERSDGVPAEETTSMKPVALPVVTPAWESIESIVDANEDESPMQIPHDIDHRFFVNDAPKCFYDSLMEDRDEGQDEGGM